MNRDDMISIYVFNDGRVSVETAKDINRNEKLFSGSFIRSAGNGIFCTCEKDKAKWHFTRLIKRREKKLMEELKGLKKAKKNIAQALKDFEVSKEANNGN